MNRKNVMNKTVALAAAFGGVLLAAAGAVMISRRSRKKQEPVPMPSAVETEDIGQEEIPEAMPELELDSAESTVPESEEGPHPQEP